MHSAQYEMVVYNAAVDCTSVCYEFHIAMHNAHTEYQTNLLGVDLRIKTMLFFDSKRKSFALRIAIKWKHTGANDDDGTKKKKKK